MNVLDEKLVANLCMVLEKLEQGYIELTGSLRGRIESMRSAQMNELQAARQRETAALQTIEGLEGLRRLAMDKIGRQLGLAPAAARCISLSQLCARLPETQAQSLLKAANTLRAAIADTARANRIAGVAARELVNHLRRVWEFVHRAGAEPGYTRHGRLAGAKGPRVLDALG